MCILFSGVIHKLNKLKYYVHNLRRLNYDCDFKIELELMTLHLQEESAVCIALINQLTNESISTQGPLV